MRFNKFIYLSNILIISQVTRLEIILIQVTRLQVDTKFKMHI